MNSRHPTLRIGGEPIPFSETAAYVVADDIARGSDPRRPPEEADQRFLPVRDVIMELERIADHDRALAWLVTPNASLRDFRPLELLADGEVAAVKAAMPTTQDQFPSLK